MKTTNIALLNFVTNSKNFKDVYEYEVIQKIFIAIIDDDKKIGDWYDVVASYPQKSEYLVWPKAVSEDDRALTCNIGQFWQLQKP